jgi:hypothetical protein
MGGTNSKESDLQKFLYTHTKLKAYTDERYGKVVLFQQNSNPENLVMLKERWTANSTTEAAAIHEIELVANMPNINLLEFFGHFKKKETTFCSSFTKHYSIFKFPPRTLKTEIDIWSKKRTSDDQYMVSRILLTIFSFSRRWKFGIWWVRLWTLCKHCTGTICLMGTCSLERCILAGLEKSDWRTITSSSRNKQATPK